jgi:hypothetical protein
LLKLILLLHVQISVMLLIFFCAVFVQVASDALLLLHQRHPVGLLQLLLPAL